MPQYEDDTGMDEQTELTATDETEEIAHSNGTSNRLAAIEQNQQILAMLQDPQIHAVIQARRAGKTVKVVEETEETPEPPAAADDLVEGLEETDPVKPTLQKIGKHIDTRVSARDAEIEALKAKVAELSTVADVIKERDVTDQITKAKEKFKDLGAYRDPMVKLAGQYPGLSVEELYYLSKARAGKLKQVEQGTFTERPTTQPARSSLAARRNPSAAPTPGKKGFASILAKSLKHADFDSE